MRTLHVLNGDSTRTTLERSGVPGDFTVWAHVLHDGPVPNVPAAELRRIRAQYHERHEPEAGDEDLPDADAWDAALERYGEYDEIVFWFEHDLFDQLILIRHLDWLSQIRSGGTRFSLICIGEYPGRPRFGGLGELAPSELAGLFPQRRPITSVQVALGTKAWGLFRAPDPMPLLDWIDQENLSPLPFLNAALHRHFEDFPSVTNGLSRSESQILTAILAGHSTSGDIFVATQAMEERIFMGDWTFWSIVRRMAAAPFPLVTVTGDNLRLPFTYATVEITSSGRDVLSGQQDHIRLNGIDRWMGGVHLTTERHWRWDCALLNFKPQTANS